MSTKILSREVAEQKIFKKHGDKIKLLEYEGTSKPAHFECSVCKYDWWTQGGSVINNGMGCGRCSRSIAYTEEEVYKTIESFGCELLASEYHGRFRYLTIKFTCGHIDGLSMTQFLGKELKICGDCANRNYLEFRRRESEKSAIELINSYGFEFSHFLDGYTTNLSKVVYYCGLGHKNVKTIISFRGSPFCTDCSITKKRREYSGEKSLFWKGGTSDLRSFIMRHLKGWRKKSVENCNHKCVVSGEDYYYVHHLYSFNLIVKDAFSILNLPILDDAKLYSQNERDLIISRVLIEHDKHPLGVCLTKEIHNLFHKIYGRGDNTPQQWDEFISMRGGLNNGN